VCYSIKLVVEYDVALHLTLSLICVWCQTLEEISRYAEDLAAAKAAAAEAELEDDDEEVVREDSEDVDDLPDDVPTKASVVVKEINSNRYYYYQWREGSKVKSKYKAPVNPDSDD
jgi:hypothetical protein